MYMNIMVILHSTHVAAVLHHRRQLVQYRTFGRHCIVHCRAQLLQCPGSDLCMSDNEFSFSCSEVFCVVT